MKQFKALSFLSLLFFAVFSVLAGCTNEQDAVSSKPANETKQTAIQGDTVSSNSQTASSSEQAAIPEKLKKPVKIAAIMQMSIGTFSSQYIAGVKEQVQKFGGEVQIYNADNDLTKMASYVETAITQNVDAILLDHGRADALEGPVKKAVEKGIPVVAFDNDLNVPGVTVIDQDDYSLAWKTLKTLAEDLNGEGNIVTIWVGGFTPMERRHVIYEAFKKRYPNIKEVAKFGTASANTALDTQTQMEAILKKYPNKGDIDAVFATWDEFAKGATRAIEQAGRTEIKVYGIDLSDEDLQMIQKPNSPWVATTATDPAEVGRVQVRFAYQKIAGEKTPNIYSLEPHLVKRTDLPDKQVSMNELSQYIPGWGQSNVAISPWMKTLEAQVNKK
ncbi:sugar ABC transporter substrate-binding protein [Geobacillus stearothermophilus]|uniref:sugar ABC transporter substrate-binding protein n=1 Tax=Geobacillus stearothermophilus TaxID=1422 RepID=UPI001F1E3D98|nr:sugar ABC transporter substrate-binding protein [Geobacillus stearothermophilus]MCK7605683.1 sugar ABC transporter substrate-binding protein [Geobacillus stearothermophilus]MED5078016.1 sugar ABC transporter substrate-binding protein [Geobacillus stearothermophilus]